MIGVRGCYADARADLKRELELFVERRPLDCAGIAGLEDRATVFAGLVPSRTK
jgi:hypothetical protein